MAPIRQTIPCSAQSSLLSGYRSFHDKACYPDGPVEYLIPTFPVLDADVLADYHAYLGHSSARVSRDEQIRVGPFWSQSEARQAFVQELRSRYCNAAFGFEVRNVSLMGDPEYIAVGTQLLVARPVTRHLTRSPLEDRISEPDFQAMTAKALVVQSQIHYAESRLRNDFRVSGCSYAALSLASLMPAGAPHVLGLPASFHLTGAVLGVVLFAWCVLNALLAFSHPVSCPAHRYLPVESVEHSPLYSEALLYVRGEWRSESRREKYFGYFSPGHNRGQCVTGG